MSSALISLSSCVIAACRRFSVCRDSHIGDYHPSVFDIDFNRFDSIPLRFGFAGRIEGAFGFTTNCERIRGSSKVA